MKLDAVLGAGDHEKWGGNEAGDVALGGDALETVPSSVGDFFEIGAEAAAEIEEDDGEVAVAQDEIGGLEELGGVATADPEDVGEEGGIEGLGVEAVRGIDEGDGAVIEGRGAEDGIKDGEAASGIGCGADFCKSAFPEAAAEGLVEGGDTGGKEEAAPWWGGGEPLGEEFAQLKDGGVRRHEIPMRLRLVKKVFK